MYQAFYGLKEIPFSIAPNPKYLFLSERHQEALGHLQYCLDSGGGFLLLTGEVGTGKTTLARTLLSKIASNTDIAYILNPSLTEIELLATLCDELAITYSPSPSLKELVDAISGFLIDNHNNGRKTLLVIDEAQHLRAEVLEQLRLLTNLETDHDKLLQVMLIGQPELQQQLKQQHLRQLAQRITARYHLMPLEASEVSAYIAHRLKIAGREHVLFSKKSCNRIFELSEGIPRVINLICDKALLLAYGEQLTEVDISSVNRAASQVLFVDYQMPATSNAQWLKPMLSSTVVIVGVLGIAWGGLNFYRVMSAQNEHGVVMTTPVAESAELPLTAPLTASSVVPSTAPLVIPTARDNLLIAPVANVVIQPTAIDINQHINPYLAKSRLSQSAFSGLMGLWGTAQGAGVDHCNSAKQYGLRCVEGTGWDQLLGYNHPAMFSFRVAGQTYFAVAVAVDSDNKVLIQLFDQQLVVNKSWLLQHWTGAFTVLWQPPTGFNRYLKLGQQGGAVTELASMLNQFYQLPNSASYSFDQVLAQLVRRFQAEHQLTVDGIAGEQTLLKLQIATARQGQTLLNDIKLAQFDAGPNSTLIAKRVALPPVYIEPARYQAKLAKKTAVAAPINKRVSEPPKSTAANFDQLVTQDGISADLAQRFSQALAAMEAEQLSEPLPAKLHPQALVYFPQWYQDLVPPLQFSSHIYSSDRAERWVKVNRQVVKEGELINADLRLVKVTPERVVIEMQQRQFTLPALTDW